MSGQTEAQRAGLVACYSCPEQLGRHWHKSSPSNQDEGGVPMWRDGGDAMPPISFAPPDSTRTFWLTEITAALPQREALVAWIDVLSQPLQAIITEAGNVGSVISKSDKNYESIISIARNAERAVAVIAEMRVAAKEPR